MKPSSQGGDTEVSLSSSEQGTGAFLTILVACYEYPPIGGGGGVGAKQYAEAWAARGHQVVVLTSRADGLPRRELVNGVDVVRVRTLGKKERATSTLLSMLTYLVGGFVHLALNRSTYRNVQVVNTHFSLPTGPLGWAAARALDALHVLTIIGGDIYDPSKPSSPHRHASLRAVNRFLIGAADEVVAISSDTRNRAIEHYGIEREIRVINYGFDPPDPDSVADVSLPGEKGHFRLIAVGRLVPRKGFRHLIRALAELPHDVELIVVGDGPEEQALRRTAGEVGVADRVHLLGYQSRERVYGFLRKSDCFVLSSLHEGLGIVVQEAMWAGLPIVATDNGGQVDLVRQGRNGFLVPVGDPSALAAAIRTVRDDPERAAEMARRNRKDIERYRIGENSEEYVTLFRRLRSGVPDRVGEPAGKEA